MLGAEVPRCAIVEGPIVDCGDELLLVGFRGDLGTPQLESEVNLRGAALTDASVT